MIELTEAEVKHGVEEYLQYAMNQGKLWWCRLNAGDIVLPNKDGSRRMFKGVKPGTADIMVIQGGQVQFSYRGKLYGEPHKISFVTFVECKSSKGKQSELQVEFQEMITGFHCRYAVVRSTEELQEVLERE